MYTVYHKCRSREVISSIEETEDLARSTMAEERLAHLSVIAMHYKDQIPADEVCTKSSTVIVDTVFV